MQPIVVRSFFLANNLVTNLPFKICSLKQAVFSRTQSDLLYVRGITCSGITCSGITCSGITHVASRTCAHVRVPGPPVFQRATLKSWEWPGDEARKFRTQLHHKSRVLIDVASVGETASSTEKAFSCFIA